MTDFLRTRDCVVFSKDTSYGVSITTATATLGWSGGQGFQWEDSTSDDFLVKISSGSAGGFALWGSNETSDSYTSMVGATTRYKFVTLCTGNWIFSTSTYEKYTYASRQAGPLVPIVYLERDPLVFSLRGYWTKEDEWSLSGDPRAPNTNTFGYVTQVPSTLNNQYLGIQTTL